MYAGTVCRYTTQLKLSGSMLKEHDRVNKDSIEKHIHLGTQNMRFTNHFKYQISNININKKLYVQYFYTLTHSAGSGSGSSWGTGCGPGRHTDCSVCDTGGTHHHGRCSGVRGSWWVWHSAHVCLFSGPLGSWCSPCPVDQSRPGKCCDTLDNTGDNKSYL